MPNFTMTARFNKLPVIGFVPEKSGTAPTTPVTGQLWTDTSVTPNVDRFYDGTTWQAWLILGTAAGSAADGSTILVKANNLSDLTNVATARTNLGLGTAATTNTGTGVANTILGNDARLSDTRTPTDGTVTGGTGVGAKIAATTIVAANIANATITDVQIAATNKDGAAATPSLRTLGLGAAQALSGTTRLDQIGAAGADVNLNGFTVTGLRAPFAASDAVRFTDLQVAQAGIDAKPSVRALATANIALTGTQTIDAVVLVAGDRVLVAGQTTGSQNGSYIVAAGAWARTPDGINPNSLWAVEEGTVYHDSQWWVTNDGVVTLGTTALVISQFAGPTTIVGTTNRVTVTVNQVDISAAYVGQTSIVTLGTITTGVWTGTAIAVANGGTGATAPLGARTNLGAPQAGYAAALGAVVAGTPLVITHSLNTQDVIAQVRDASTNEYMYLDVINASVNTVTITSGIAFGAGALRIVVLPVA